MHSVFFCLSYLLTEMITNRKILRSHSTRPRCLQSTSTALHLHHFNGILVGFVILMVLADLHPCVVSAFDIPSSLALNIIAAYF